MSRALQLAKQGLYTCHPNPRVGCVISQGDKIVAEGYHQKAGEGHAEVNALNSAATSVEGAKVYVSLEPCCHQGRTPACTQALISAKVGEVVVAMKDPNPLVSGKGIEALRSAGIKVRWGVLSQQAAELNPGFIMRMAHERPFVRSKMAMSLDGRTAMASGESQWITGEGARADVQRWRAQSSAIMTGVNTVLQDDPRLNVRTLTQDKQSQPIRVILDSQLRLPPDRKLFALDGANWIFTCVQQALNFPGDTSLIRQDGGQRLDLNWVLEELAKREINEVLVEAGGTLNGALLSAGLVDELIIYIAAKFLGNNAKGLLQLPDLRALKDGPELEINDMRMIGKDIRLIARVKS